MPDVPAYTALTEEQKTYFDANGYLVIQDAIDPETLQNLNAAVDEIYDRFRRDGLLREDGQLNLRNCITHHEDFIPLLDWPATAPLAWGVLNWNIQMVTSHLVVLPSVAEPSADEKRKNGMHRDGGRSDREMEEPHPRILLKIAYVLSDQTNPDCGATRLVPGSNRLTGYPAVDPETGWPIGTIPMNLPAGSAFMFEQRTYHSIARNWSGIDRRTLFMGYAYRWIKPMDYITMPESVVSTCNPIQKQLVGVVGDAISYYLPEEEDVPLKGLLGQ